jgi:hypothetical protein
MLPVDTLFLAFVWQYVLSASTLPDVSSTTFRRRCVCGIINTEYLRVICSP